MSDGGTPTPQRLILLRVVAAWMRVSVIVFSLIVGAFFISVFLRPSDPPFLVSSAYIEYWKVPAYLIGLAIGAICAAILLVPKSLRLELTRHTSLPAPDPRREVKSVYGKAFYALVLVVIMAFAVKEMILEAFPYWFSSGQGIERTEVVFMGYPVSQKMGDGWRLVAVNGHRRLVPIRSRLLRHCLSDGSQLTLTGEEGSYGMYVHSLVALDSRHRDMIEIDFLQGTYRVPNRCT
ncbi:hypothetical protein JANAI62_05520 [Jannaschia pagri]|uniref:Uncharacterized protein n=1 Tax=Jannaschia pagri TaxID=2829797 RepID=A0ABQ4NIA9_9RHOB|nr:hypothetical protein JANAI61_04220 [Jannaschia sp. AI_61]GIT93929.1 hypothetical protein JANAI62_05520 [Jannaschia sp. AI_62]